MADIDLKTETPDTTLPTTGFLFGADSQAAASPSVFTVQSVATTLLGSTTLTGATVTTSSPVIDAAQTWNDGAVTFTGLKFNAATGSNAGSAAASLLMDLQLEGTSRFSVRKDGTIFLPSSRGIFFGGSGFSNIGILGDGVAQLGFVCNGDTYSGVINAVGQRHFSLASNALLVWSATTSYTAPGGPDLLLSRRAAANLRLGAADAAAPVAQTLSVQSVVAGTTNTAGANLTITGSQGTGTGAGGSIVFQVAPAGSSGTAQNALVDALTINSARQVLVGAGTASLPSISFSGDENTGIYSTGSDNISFSTNGSERFRMGSGGLFTSVGGISLGNNTGSPFSRIDASAAGVILISNFSQNDLARLQFGGTTSSFPALKRSSAALIVRLADDTANAALESASLKTDAPTGGTAATWKLGTVATVSPTSPNRTIEVDIGGTIYYLSAKTTND